MGYRVQGNEFSLYMLLASDFILNGGVATPDQPLSISPWLLESRNVHTSQDPVRVVTIPDVDPYTMLADCQEDDEDDDENEDKKRNKLDSYFSMAAGDFAMIYSHPQERGQWNAVVCCFFLDAAPSIVEYIQIIYRMLRPGGILMNFGPLLYHWSGPAMRPDDRSFEDYQARFSYLDSRYMNSVDLSWEDVRDILVNVGFEILEENPGQRALYTADRKSMMNLGYRCVNFVARKTKDRSLSRGMFDSVSDSSDEEDDEDDME
jgi:carnosine N-methyltransferase